MTILPEFEHEEIWRVVWHNWRAEWLTLFGEARSWLLADDRELVTFDFSMPNGLVLARDGVVLGQVDAERWRDPDAISAVLQNNAIVGSCDAALRLPRRELLSRRIELPYMSATALKGALTFELERLTPLPPSRLYFDFRNPARDRKTNRTVIDVRLIKREAVDDAVALAHGIGANIAAIRFDGETRDADWRNFPVDRPAFLRHLWRRFGLAACAGLAALLLIGLLAASYARSAAINAAYDAEIAQAQRQAHAVALIDRQIRDAKAALSFPVRQKQRPLATSTLTDLAQALPNNSWISELELSGGQLHVRGLSQSASDLIAALDRSGHFARATFSAPIVRNPQDKSDHFDLTAGVVGPSP